MSDINHNRMIPLHVADRAVANCEEEIQRLRDKMFVLTCKGAAMAGYLQAIAESRDMMPDQGELQRLLKKSISEWEGAVEDAGWKGGKR
jgi:uncharacterized membrane protein YccC